MADQVEREAKLEAGPEFTIPDLGGVVGGVSVGPADAKELDAVYYDTDDLRLVRAGITVRHRTSDRDTGTWTIKLPDDDGDPAGVMSRREIEVDGPAGTMPALVAGLTVAHSRTARLQPVAHIQTRRDRRALRTADGRVVGEVDDDDVSVLDGERVTAHFREVEVEVAAGAPAELLDALVARLRAAGAGAPDPTPKLVRALGPRALEPADLAPVELGSKPTVAEVVQAGITNAVIRIVDHDPVIRLDDDPEGVHQARVGTRRLRSDLRTFLPVLDEQWAEDLRAELKWLAGELGAVRDADVLLARLRAQVLQLPKGDQPEGDRLAARLAKERDQAHAALLTALDSARYPELLDRLVAAAREPHVQGRDADRRAAKVLPTLVSRPWRKLRRTVAALPAPPSDEALHGVRIRAKRARYAADVAVPVVGKDAERFADALADLQDELGEHHDSIVAEEWLRGAAAASGATKAQSLVAGELIAVQRQEAAARRETWPALWKQASKAKRTAWLT